MRDITEGDGVARNIKVYEVRDSKVRGEIGNKTNVMGSKTT